ncbi:hypothetical protein TcWFU_000860 [Taenia crassiceps]|uniref:Uncharacterized protein n=1 Tax=Taenia crassiceps TaxID=6207 RepID=A0ABR4QFN6_9CEST
MSVRRFRLAVRAWCELGKWACTYASSLPYYDLCAHNAHLLPFVSPHPLSSTHSLFPVRLPDCLPACRLSNHLSLYLNHATIAIAEQRLITTQTNRKYERDPIEITYIKLTAKDPVSLTCSKAAHDLGNCNHCERSANLDTAEGGQESADGL